MMSLLKFSLRFVSLSMLLIVVALTFIATKGESWSYQLDSLLLHIQTTKIINSSYAKEENAMSQSTTSSYMLGEWVVAYYDYFSQSPYKLIPVGQLSIRETSYQYISFGGESETMHNELLFVQAPDGVVRCTSIVEGVNQDLVRHSITEGPIAECEFVHGDTNQLFYIAAKNLRDYGQVWTLVWNREPGRMSAWEVFKKVP